MTVIEKICPICKHKNESDANFCSHCGTALERSLMGAGTKTRTTNILELVKGRIRDLSLESEKVTAPESGIAIYVEDLSEPVYINSSKEFVIGRGVRSKSLLDLSPWGGFHLGLSRRHAEIRRTDHGYEILDLGSTNGTWLNNEKLIPHKSYPLASNAYLRLGHLQLFVIYRTFTETEHKL